MAPSAAHPPAAPGAAAPCSPPPPIDWAPHRQRRSRGCGGRNLEPGEPQQQPLRVLGALCVTKVTVILTADSPLRFGPQICASDLRLTFSVSFSLPSFLVSARGTVMPFSSAGVAGGGYGGCRLRRSDAPRPGPARRSRPVPPRPPPPAAPRLPHLPVASFAAKAQNLQNPRLLQLLLLIQSRSFQFHAPLPSPPLAQ